MPRNRSNEPYIPLDFGNALKAARKAQKLTTTELARRIDKTDPSISRYESGQGLPPKTTLEAIEREVKASLSKEWQKVRPLWKAFLKARKEKERAEKSPALETRTPSRLVLNKADELKLVRFFRRLTPKQRSAFNDFMVDVEDKIDHFITWLEKAS